MGGGAGWGEEQDGGRRCELEGSRVLIRQEDEGGAASVSSTRRATGPAGQQGAGSLFKIKAQEVLKHVWTNGRREERGERANIHPGRLKQRSSAFLLSSNQEIFIDDF